MGELGMKQMHRGAVITTLWTCVYGSMPFFLFIFFFLFSFHLCILMGDHVMDENGLGIWNICTLS